MARKASTTEKTVDFDLVTAALAKAVTDGDFVNLRLLFAPFSPARAYTSESFDEPKYEYLLPDDDEEETTVFTESRFLVRQPLIMAHVKAELEAKRAPQLPGELVLALADNAVRLGKYGSAAQAYEMLRIRERMQQIFLEKADEALAQGDVKAAVHGYVIASGLDYDYAAFPEPLPATLDFQTRSLLLHAEYPAEPDAAIGTLDTEPLLQKALVYLLGSSEIATRLDGASLDVRLQFLAELVRQRDPEWAVFAERYREAAQQVEELREHFRGLQERRANLAEEIEVQELPQDPSRVPAVLLGREIEGGEWWQYLKELAGEHPAAALFVARQVVGKIEIIIPRHRPDSPVARALRLPPQ